MKLYYAPGACSMAPHIALVEAGLKVDLEKVDLGTHKTASGEDYTKINPKGYVPALQLDNGEMLTEVGVLLQYIADQKPDAGLAPKVGTMERYHLMEWLNFVSTEVHKQFGPMFNPKITAEHKTNQLNLLNRRFDYLSQQLTGKQYLMGAKFSVVDAYLFTVLNWSNFLNIDMAKWPVLKDYMARVAGRTAVKDTLKAEGLAK